MSTLLCFCSECSSLPYDYFSIAGSTMDQLVYERLLEDSTLFAPTGNHRAIDISVAPDSSQRPHIKETVLAEKQIISWCRERKGDGTAALFRLLICSPRIADRDICPLPVSSNSLSSILNALQLPPLFPRAVCRHIPIASLFQSFDAPERYGVLLRTNLSHTWQYALALTYEKDSNTTTAILFGLRGNEIDDLVYSLRQAAAHTICPSVLPCILVDKALDTLVKDAEERRKSLIQIRFETGSHGFPRQNVFNDSWDGRDDLDLDVLMQKLTSLSDACAGITAVCKMQYNFLDAISEFQGRFDPTDSLPASRYARQQLKFFTQYLHGVESKVTYTKSSVQDQVQTIYTMINLRESRSQMILAKASQRLSELSRKDSTDMRVISAVTLVFLPATFTSTFFSASFFNFQPDDSSHISTWIWLYWAVTALLTAVVLASWWYFSHRQHAKSLAAARKESFPAQKNPEKPGPDLVVHQPIGRLEIPRPYLGGSIADAVFAREGMWELAHGPYACYLANGSTLVTLPPVRLRRADTGNISPTATFAP
jgi:hypothetical protein